MKKIGLFFMVVGILAPLNSTFFTAVNMQHDVVLIISFCGLLLLCQMLSAWILLVSKSKINEHPQRIAFAIVIVLALVWFAIVYFRSDQKLIFLWALNALSFSVPYFAGLLIYKREKQM